MADTAQTSLWHLSSQERFSAPAFTGDAAANLVIIGGGYTGCSAALHAASAGASVCLLEAKSIGHGGSGRNVGLCNAGLWLPPEKIEARLGPAAGQRLSNELAVAPDLVFGLIEQHGIACEAKRHGTLHCAHAPSGMKDLEDRFRQQTDRGAPVELLGPEEARARVGSDRVHGALFDPRAGTIQPLAYVQGLARAAARAGADIHEKSPVTAVSRVGSTWIVQTPKGRVRAERLLVATNGYAEDITGLQTPTHVGVSYFQGATPPLTPEQRAGILDGGEGCWDTALVMSSWRMDARGRLVIGAMGNPDHAAGGIHRAWLQRKMVRLFPSLKGVKLESLWAGNIAMTAEYLPKILRTGPDALTVFGYSGRGIGPGTLFGKRAAQALLSGKLDTLPLPPVDTHSLPLATLRGRWIETGAVLTHAVKSWI